MALPALGYAVLFLVLLWPQLGLFPTHLPATPNSNDAQLIVWILSWVEHAARDASATLFDANINFPAPSQLTGSDYFLSSQLVFAPLVWLTGNAVLAVNLTALLTYWLAALACERLLRALGCSAGVAFVTGLSFALSRLQIPFNVHVLQYPIFLFPLLALALLRLRERPDVRRMLRVAAVFALGTFASFYAAILLGVVGLVWALRELAYASGRRLRFIALGLTAVVLAVLPLLPVLHAYLQRATHQGIEGSEASNSPLLTLLLDPLATLDRMTFVPVDLGLVALSALSLVALPAWLLRDPVARSVVPVALALIVVGDTLMARGPQALLGTVVSDLFRFLRYSHRFSTVVGFGATLLLAAALAALTRWAPRTLGRVATLAVLLVVLLDHGMALRGGTPLEAAALSRDRPVHRAVGELARERGHGPLLVLPTSGQLVNPQGRARSLEPDAMLASTLHWLPLINGYTGHQPAHRMLLIRLIGALPHQGALDDLIDLTHLRWILLRPATAWREPSQRTSTEAALRASPAVARAWDVDGWALLEVARTPQHPSWFQAVATGTGPTTTVLGTPLAPLPAGADSGVVELSRPLPDVVPVKTPLYAPVTITNRGGATWPAMPAPVPGLILDLLVPGEMPRSGSVLLIVRWRALDERQEADDMRREVRLRRDVAPGETLEEKVLLVTPDEPGRYQLELALEQIDGARFSDPGNARAHHDLRVVPAAARTAPPARVAR